MTINFVTVNQSDKLLTQIKGLSARVFPLRACGISRRNYVLNKSSFWFLNLLTLSFFTNNTSSIQQGENRLKQIVFFQILIHV